MWVCIGHSNLVNGKRQNCIIEIILVNCPNGNHVIGCINSQNISKWNVFKLEYYNYPFGLAYSLLDQDNGCIVFIHRGNANSMGQLTIVPKEVLVLN